MYIMTNMAQVQACDYTKCKTRNHPKESCSLKCADTTPFHFSSIYVLRWLTYLAATFHPQASKCSVSLREIPCQDWIVLHWYPSSMPKIFHKREQIKASTSQKTWFKCKLLIALSANAKACWRRLLSYMCAYNCLPILKHLSVLVAVTTLLGRLFSLLVLPYSLQATIHGWMKLIDNQ